MEDLTDVSALAAGDSHTLAPRTDGTVWAWGRNGSGQLADGTVESRSVPAQVTGVKGRAVALAAGSDNSLPCHPDGDPPRQSNPENIDYAIYWESC